DHDLPAHEWRAADAPVGHLPVGVVEHVARPDLRAGCGVEADEGSRGALRVDAAVVERWRGARAEAAQGFDEAARLLVGPQFGPGLGVAADDRLLVAALFLRECASVHDGHRRPAGADGPAPE